MLPRPDDRAHRPTPLGGDPQDRRGVFVGEPAVEQQGRVRSTGAGNIGGLGRPVSVPRGVGEPGNDPRPVGLQALHPLAPPALAHLQGIGRQGVEHQHHAGPVDAPSIGRAAEVMDVGRPAVLGNAAQDERLEGLRSPGRHAKGHEGGPGKPAHADRAIAPRLGGAPVHRRRRVVQFDLTVLVRQQPFGAARAGVVQGENGVAMPGPIRQQLLFQRTEDVEGAVGADVEDDRDAIIGARPPEPTREPAAVAHRDEDEAVGDVVRGTIHGPLAADAADQAVVVVETQTRPTKTGCQTRRNRRA